ncbi:family 43 glycosylhydrolase [Parabacteroides sp. Marseille-P3160]|uniref:family 43 glycosylhydrolase n=1 Tax=Parabacteroides sp. Marseille-P3160 TaxID=1917887 RepID=UPI0009BBD7FF|nr:family 43 glycosylhydrolase [Parabacteroides sp. Marseille-P3160]
MRNLFLLSTFNVFFIFAIYGQQNYFTNPVIRGDLADPSIIRIGNKYYATATSSEWAPFYPIFLSTDLVNWKQTGAVFNEQPGWTSNSFWAPELFYHNDKVFCYYTARRKTDGISYIGVASADSPDSKFMDHGPIVEYGTEAIDAFVYDDKGELYITWKAYGLDKRPIELLGSKLSADGLHLEGESFSLLKDNEGIGMEGQCHFKYGDYYYIIYAAHGCCGPRSDYDVYVARSKNFKGPYEKYEKNPVLQGGEGDYISCGHGTVVTTKEGRLFYMCHAYLKGDGFYAGRQPILQEVFVGDDNWLHFKTGNIALRKQSIPYKGTEQTFAESFKDNFTDSVLKKDWSWNYPYANIDIIVGNNKLILSGTPINNNLFGTALCLRPQVSDYSYQTEVINKNESFKGLTMYGDDKNLIAWGVSGNNVILQSVKDGESSVLYNHSYSSNNIYLKINVERGCFLSFYQSMNGIDWERIEISSFDSQYLTRWDRVPRFGLIHIGEHLAPAEFSFFKSIYGKD